MSQVLGIDIGSYTAKFAFIEVEKSSVVLKNVIEIPIPQRTQAGEEKLAKIQTLRQTLESFQLSNIKDNIYAGLPSQYTILQKFEFLKVSQRNLSKIIANEFDELGLFSLDDYLVEYSVLQKNAKLTQVIGILIKKSAARDLIEILSAINLNTRIIDIESLSFQNLIPYTTQLGVLDEPSIHFIVNIGHSKTSVIVIENQQVVLERSFNLAGSYITSRIQEACSLSFEEAQYLKHQISGSVEYTSAHTNIAKSVLLECCEEISKEIKRIILGYTQSSYVTKIDSVILTGGTSKIFDLAKNIEKHVGIHTVTMDISNGNFRNSCSKDFIFETYAQAIALALRGTAAKTNSKLNIRHGELALMSDYENIIAQIFSYAKMVSVIAICLLSTYFLRYYLYNNKINQIKNLYTMQINNYFGSEPVQLRAISAKENWNFEKYNSEALKIIDTTYKQKVDFINDIYSEKSMLPIVVLNEISNIIPKTLYFEVNDYKFQDGILTIQADTDSKDSLTTIIELMSSLKYFTNLQKKSEAIKPGTNGEIIKFSIIATVQYKGNI